jgi:hypothetical protein
MSEIFRDTLEEALVKDPTLLDNLQMSTTAQTTMFKDIFKARWNIYECAGFSIAEFKKFIENKFKSWLPYYQELIDDYENRITYQDGIVNSEIHSETYTADGSVDKTDTASRNNVYTELPNKVTNKEYPSNKDDTNENLVSQQSYEDSHSKGLTITRTGDVNILEQKIKYQKYLRNIYLEFANKFDVCFVLLY